GGSVARMPLIPGDGGTFDRPVPPSRGRGRRARALDRSPGIGPAIALSGEIPAFGAAAVRSTRPGRQGKFPRRARRRRLFGPGGSGEPAGEFVAEAIASPLA